MQGRLDKIMDMVLFRYGSTGVWQVIQSAVKCMNPTIIYPVTSYTTFKGPRGGVSSDSNLPSAASILTQGICSALMSSDFKSITVA